MRSQHLARLKKRILSLEEKNRKLGTWRSAAFLAALAFVVLGALDVIPGPAFLAAGVCLVSFFVLMGIHGRVRSTLAHFRSRWEVEDRQEATAVLDWSRIPFSVAPDFNLRPAALTDLNIVGEQGIFRLLNQTISTAGARHLMGLFLSDQVDELEIRRRTRLVRELKELRFLRYSFLSRVRGQKKTFSNEDLTALMAEPLSELKSVWPFLWICFLQAAMILSFLRYAGGDPRPFFMVPALALIFESIRLRAKVHARRAYGWSLSAAASLESLRTAVGLLERYSRTKHPELSKTLACFRTDRSATTRLKQLDRISGALGARQNFIVHGLLHLVFPWDLAWTLRLERLRVRIKEDLVEWQRALAEFEAFMSLATYADANPDFSFGAQIENGDCLMDATDLRHPLIPRGRAIGNDLKIDDTEKCILITGSNMSGKSTFLRSVGVNFLLAKAGAPVAARSFLFQNRPLYTSLSGGDSLHEGLSSFYAEVKRLKEMLDIVRSGRKTLFLIDEIFRGTNNRERLIGSQAFLKEIVRKGGMGLVTSHDLELAQLEELGIGIVNYHFKETIQGSEMSFTFKKAKGPCPSSNALRVMEINGLPT